MVSNLATRHKHCFSEASASVGLAMNAKKTKILAFNQKKTGGSWRYFKTSST